MFNPVVDIGKSCARRVNCPCVALRVLLVPSDSWDQSSLPETHRYHHLEDAIFFRSSLSLSLPLSIQSVILPALLLFYSSSAAALSLPLSSISCSIFQLEISIDGQRNTNPLPLLTTYFSTCSPFPVSLCIFLSFTLFPLPHLSGQGFHWT